MKKLIKAAPAGLSNPYDGETHDLDIALADYVGNDRVGKALVFSSAELNEGFENADSDVKELLNFDVDGEEITVTPSTEEQVIMPSQEKNAILKVTVEGVTSAIDANIVPENIKKDVIILGVTGTYELTADDNDEELGVL